MFFVASGTASEDIKIKDVCKWYHEEILGWHQSYLLFKKRHLDFAKSRVDIVFFLRHQWVKEQLRGHISY